MGDSNIPNSIPNDIRIESKATKFFKKNNLLYLEYIVSAGSQSNQNYDNFCNFTKI